MATGAHIKAGRSSGRQASTGVMPVRYMRQKRRRPVLPEGEVTDVLRRVLKKESAHRRTSPAQKSSSGTPTAHTEALHFRDAG